MTTTTRTLTTRTATTPTRTKPTTSLCRMMTMATAMITSRTRARG